MLDSFATCAEKNASELAEDKHLTSHRIQKLHIQGFPIEEVEDYIWSRCFPGTF